jgi:hypothetical protein
VTVDVFGNDMEGNGAAVVMSHVHAGAVGRGAQRRAMVLRREHADRAQISQLQLSRVGCDGERVW